MAWTLATLKQAIQDYLENSETTFVSKLDVIIKQAEERILKDAQLSVFRKNATANVIATQPYLSKPSDYLSPYSLAIDDAGQEFLLFKDVNFLRSAYPDASVTGVPRYYSSFDVSTFILAPTPALNYEAELHYFYRPESITTANTTWLGTNAPTALLYGCLVEGYTFNKGDADLMQVYAQRYEQALRRLEEFGEGYETTDNYRSGQVRKQRT